MSGKLLVVLGKEKGKGPGEFQNPYGLAVDAQGYLYVNDRGNSRVQVFDSSLNFIKSFYIGQAEGIFVRKYGSEATIITVGVAPVPCGDDQAKCLIQEYDTNGKLIRTFGRYDEPVVTYSWVVGLGPNGRTYLANVLDQELKTFEPDGALGHPFSLRSPSIIPLTTKLNPNPQSMNELRATIKVLNEEKHTELAAIFVDKSFLYVSHRLKEKDQTPKFLLDIFDLQGNLRFYGIEMPGDLQCLTEKLYVVKEKQEERFGGLEIAGIQLRPGFEVAHK